MTGVMALPEGGRVDFARLRAARRRRLLEAMEEFGLDALILGRAANITYASGARQLWTAGARPFGAGGVVVRATGRVHILSVWDEGVPPEVSHDDLWGLSWNPANITASLIAIPGLSDSARIGTDSMSPGFPAAIARIAPAAQIVDGGPALRAARTTKTSDEVAAITTATAIAEAALEAMTVAAAGGADERALRGVYLATIARHGCPTPPTEDVIRIRGAATSLNPGALYAGYEGGVGRTIGAPPVAALDRLVAACRPGATGAELMAVAPHGHVYGLGLGMEPPLIGPHGLGESARLEEGMVLSVQARDGDAFERDVVLVLPDGPQVLSRAGRP